MTDDPQSRPFLTYDITVDHDGWGDVEPVVKQCFDVLQAHDPEEFCNGDIALLFTSNDAVQKLNRQFLGKDKPTNVLSFPAEGDDGSDAFEPGGEPQHIGDIALAYETCYNEANDKNIPLKDHAAHLIFHGILHLFGYDHQDDTDADVMERLETDLLGQIGIADPYAE